MSRPSRDRALSLAATLLIACGGGAEPEGDTPDPRALSSGAPVRIDTLPGGRVVVENAAPRGSGGWSLGEDLRLGTATESGPEQFGQLYTGERSKGTRSSCSRSRRKPHR